MDEVETNISMARDQGQISAAIRGTEQALKLSGLLSDQPRDSAVVITKVTVVLNHGRKDPEDDTPALEASYRVLPRGDESE